MHMKTNAKMTLFVTSLVFVLAGVLPTAHADFYSGPWDAQVDDATSEYVNLDSGMAGKNPGDSDITWIRGAWNQGSSHYFDLGVADTPNGEHATGYGLYFGTKTASSGGGYDTQTTTQVSGYTIHNEDGVKVPADLNGVDSFLLAAAETNSDGSLSGFKASAWEWDSTSSSWNQILAEGDSGFSFDWGDTTEDKKSLQWKLDAQMSLFEKDFVGGTFFDDGGTSDGTADLTAATPEPGTTALAALAALAGCAVVWTNRKKQK